MKQNTNAYRLKINSALVSLGVIFLLIFSLAFACNDSSDEDRSDTPIDTRTNRGGGNLTRNDVENYVTEYEQTINPTGGISSPISIDITFGQIRFDPPRKANDGDKLRKVMSAELYPVVVEYTVNQKFKDGIYPKKKKYKFEFYRNTEGGWSAFDYGPMQ